MKITVHAVGRMKTGPERELADRYFERFARSGPGIGLEFSNIVEIPESRAQTASERRRDEGRALQSHLQSGTALVLLDERGKAFTSEDFAGRVGLLRDGGRKEMVIAIGGADGHDQSLRDQAEMTVSFGSMTWPHQLVRVMLAEQLYRAATILSGHPYHRG
ncbi:50S rRNA methyltransferase [Mesorhizobium sp. Root554]|uniref:23S rRNA (pseudouridine(1915)-N(3))-methyltransferase RlmH n=1 Tax=unclassified Mesorhizobium TaxID=325217 RepID=UPI00070181C6|nr:MULTISPECIES: 23S rRNA (pseudouridine(1915)-N(3))-methyltransferase RlmH [unclassified Mesorhizobium]KQZ15216.1 50S rRNA methyltransferase [Mesorhizobium sp. Root1471]KQZ37725.1 50S rRNA methyltransferase [Mesorhizobium sp. Root554]